MTYGAGTGLINAPLTAQQTTALLRQERDKPGADYWMQQAPKDLVYTCTFTGPAASPRTHPCPARPSQRTFLVDAAGHATLLRLPSASPQKTCTPR